MHGEGRGQWHKGSQVAEQTHTVVFKADFKGAVLDHKTISIIAAQTT